MPFTRDVMAVITFKSVLKPNFITAFSVYIFPHASFDMRNKFWLEINKSQFHVTLCKCPHVHWFNFQVIISLMYSGGRGVRFTWFDFKCQTNLQSLAVEIFSCFLFLSLWLVGYDRSLQILPAKRQLQGNSPNFLFKKCLCTFLSITLINNHFHGSFSYPSGSLQNRL